MKQLKSFSRSTRYENFIKERDSALEVILGKYSNFFSGILDVVKEAVEKNVVFFRHVYSSEHLIGAHDSTKAFGDWLSHQMTSSAIDASNIIERLRAQTYLLSYIGEAEAIGRASGKVARVKVDGTDLTNVMYEPMLGGTLFNRVNLTFSRLGRDILDAYQMSLALNETINETRVRVLDAFPSVTTYKRPPRVLKHKQMREADSEKPSPLVTGIFPEETWREMVEFYLAESDVAQTVVRRYDWELEQDVTHDFVERVRQGQVASANENGIVDFEWIAILDNKTDECCSVRDGLSSSEIQAKLDNGEIDDVECDAIVPPAHLNCRCRLAPMTQEIIDEPRDSDFSDFDAWLNGS